jgi:hypothetical protein
MEEKKGRKQRIGKEMQSLIVQLETEGGTRQEQLKRSGLEAHIFYYWHKKFGGEVKQQSSFVEVKRINSSGSSFIRIRKGHDTELEIKDYVSASYIKELLGW